MTDQPSNPADPCAQRADADIAALGREYRVLIEHCPDAIVVHEGREIAFVNPAGLRLIGATDIAQVVGHQLAEFVVQYSIPAMRERIRGLAHVGAVSEPTPMELRRLGGRHIEVEAVSILTLWGGRPAYQAILRDMTAQRAAEAAAARAERRYTRIVSTLAEGVVVISASGAVESMNPASARILGVAGTDFSGLTLADIHLVGRVINVDGTPLGPDDFPHGQTLRTGEPAEFVVGLQRPDQPIIWISGTCQMLDTTARAPMLVSFTDVSDARRTRTQLEYQATHDSLTDLPNRSQVVTVIRSAIEDPDRPSEIAFLFLDLDNLKVINDSRGHSVGDEVLRVTAARLRDTIDARSLVGRVGGDEFVAVLLGNPVQVDSVAAEVQRALTVPIERPEWTLTVTASIGALTVPVGDQRTINDLLRDADIAMYAAKSQGGNRTERFATSLREGPRLARGGLQATADTGGGL